MGKRKRKLRDWWLLANLSMLSLLLVSIYGYYWATSVRVEQGYWVADPFVMLIHVVSHGLMTAAFFGWIVTGIIAKTRK